VAQSRQVAAATERKPRARSHRSKRPTRLRSPNQGPCPGSPEPTDRPGQQPESSFMPRAPTALSGQQRPSEIVAACVPITVLGSRRHTRLVLDQVRRGI
jgi:hypothetical protein